MGSDHLTSSGWIAVLFWSPWFKLVIHSLWCSPCGRWNQTSKSAWERSHVGQKDSLDDLSFGINSRLLWWNPYGASPLRWWAFCHIFSSSVGSRSIRKEYREASVLTWHPSIVPLALVCLLDRCFQQFWRLDQYRFSLERKKTLGTWSLPIDFKALSLPEVLVALSGAIHPSCHSSGWCLSLFWRPSLGHPCHVADLGRNHYSICIRDYIQIFKF